MDLVNSIPPKLQQVVSHADKLPFIAACLEAALHEPPESQHFLDVSEYRFYGDATLTVKLFSCAAPQLLLHDGDGSRRSRRGGLPYNGPLKSDRKQGGG